ERARAMRTKITLKCLLTILNSGLKTALSLLIVVPLNHQRLFRAVGPEGAVKLLASPCQQFAGTAVASRCCQAAWKHWVWPCLSRRHYEMSAIACTLCQKRQRRP